MLDIISMATFIIIMLLIVILLLLFLIGANIGKTDEEIYLEDQEQSNYLNTYQKRKSKKKKLKLWRYLWKKIHTLGNN